MNSKFKLGILVLVVLVIVGVLGYKYAGQNGVSKNNDKQQQQQTALNRVIADNNATDKPAEIVKQEVKSKASVPNNSERKDSKGTTSPPAVNTDDKSKPTVEPTEEKGKQPIWVLFRSTTCYPCIEMQKAMDTLTPEFKDKIRFIAIDVNDPANAQLNRDFNVQYIPATYLFDENEKLVFQQTGIISVEDMRSKLNDLLEED